MVIMPCNLLAFITTTILWLTFHSEQNLLTHAVLQPLSTQSIGFWAASWYFAILCLVFAPFVAVSAILYSLPKYAIASLFTGTDSCWVVVSAATLSFYMIVLQLCYCKLSLIGHTYYILMIFTGSILFPHQLLIHQVFYSLTAQYRHHHSHVSCMWLDRLCCLYKVNIFMVFVLGPSNQSIPVHECFHTWFFDRPL